MTSPAQPDDRHEALFITDFYPGLGAYLARQHADGYDAVAGRARFLLWLGTHADDGDGPLMGYAARAVQLARLTAEEEAELSGDRRSRAAQPAEPDAGRIDELAQAERRLSLDLGREPTPEELAAELDLPSSAASPAPRRPGRDQDL